MCYHWAKHINFKQNIQKNRLKIKEFLERKIGEKKSKIGSSLCTSIHQCTPVYMGIHQYTWVYISIHGCTPVYIGIHQYTGVYTSMHTVLWEFIARRKAICKSINFALRRNICYFLNLITSYAFSLDNINLKIYANFLLKPFALQNTQLKDS